MISFFSGYLKRLRRPHRAIVSVIILLSLTSCDNPPNGVSCYENVDFGQIASSTTEVYAQSPDVLPYCQDQPSSAAPAGCYDVDNDYSVDPPVLSYNECVATCLTVVTPNETIWQPSGIEVSNGQELRFNVAGAVNTCLAKPPSVFTNDISTDASTVSFYEWGHDYTETSPTVAGIVHNRIRTNADTTDALSSTATIMKYMGSTSTWYPFSGFSLDEGEELTIEAYKEPVGGCQSHYHDSTSFTWLNTGVTAAPGEVIQLTATGTIEHGCAGGCAFAGGQKVSYSWSDVGLAAVPTSQHLENVASTAAGANSAIYTITNTTGATRTLYLRHQDPNTGDAPATGSYSDNIGGYTYDVCVQNLAAPLGDMEFRVGASGVVYDMEDVSVGRPIQSRKVDGFVRGIYKTGNYAGYEHRISSNFVTGDTLWVRFNTATDWTIRLRTSGCPLFNGQQLMARFSTDNGASGTDIPLEGVAAMNAPTDGFIYYRVLDTEAPDDYSNNSGTYSVTVSVLKGASDVATRISEFIIEPIRELFYGPLIDPLNPAAGRDPTGSGAVVVKIYSGITTDGGFLSLASTALLLYIIIYGVVISLGVGEGAYTRYDLVVRITKLGFIYAVINPGSWQFMTEHFFTIFIDGVLDFIEFFAAPLVMYTPEVIADPDNPPATLILIDSDDLKYSSPFAFMDRTIGLFFEGPTWVKIVALILDPPLGPIYAFFIVTSLFMIMVLFMKALILFVVSIVAVGLLLTVSPFFFLTILFSQTRAMFDGWLRAMVSFTLQPVLLIVTIALMNEFIVSILTSVLSLTACWACKIQLGLPWTDIIIIPPDVLTLDAFSFCIMWFWDPQGEATQFGHIPVAFSEIIVLLIFVDLAGKFMKWSVNMAESITQAVGTSLAGATQGVWSTLGGDRIENRAKAAPSAGARTIARAGASATQGAAVFAAKTTGSGVKAAFGAGLSRSKNPYLSRKGATMSANARHGLSKRGRQVASSAPVSVIGGVGRGVWGAGQGVAYASRTAYQGGKWAAAKIGGNKDLEQKAKHELSKRGHELKKGMHDVADSAGGAIRKGGSAIKNSPQAIKKATRNLRDWKKDEIEKTKASGGTPRMDTLFGKKSMSRDQRRDATLSDYDKYF